MSKIDACKIGENDWDRGAPSPNAQKKTSRKCTVWDKCAGYNDILHLMAPLGWIDSIGLRTGVISFSNSDIWQLGDGGRVIQPTTDVALKQLIGGLGEL